MTINHITLLIPRSQFSKVVDWYTKALAPLNYIVQLGPYGPDHWTGMGPRDGYPYFWVRAADKTVPMHVAFDASSNECVRQFHEIGVSEGGTPNGDPGIRGQMSRQPYYSAYVIDPAGNNIEAVCLSGKDQ